MVILWPSLPTLTCQHGRRLRVPRPGAAWRCVVRWREPAHQRKWLWMIQWRGCPIGGRRGSTRERIPVPSSVKKLHARADGSAAVSSPQWQFATHSLPCASCAAPLSRHDEARCEEYRRPSYSRTPGLPYSCTPAPAAAVLLYSCPPAAAVPSCTPAPAAAVQSVLLF